MRFADTNVLLYEVSRDPQERHKAERADGILAERDLALSVQVLQEFYVQATRDGRADAAILEAARSLGCDTVLSEDLNDGQDYGRVTVENPFRP